MFFVVWDIGNIRSAREPFWKQLLIVMVKTLKPCVILIDRTSHSILAERRIHLKEIGQQGKYIMK